MFTNLLGFMFVFFCLLHNMHFGGENYLFTKAEGNFNLSLYNFFNALLAIAQFNFENENFKTLMYQFNIWNPLYNIHRLILLIFIFYVFLSKKQPAINYVLFLSVVSQHGLLFLTHPGGRYAYFAWILTFILFTIVFKETFIINKKNNT